MTIGIYAITHVDSGKMYIGKSIDIKRRFKEHRTTLTCKYRSATNRHLWNAVQKHGLASFKFHILQKFKEVDEDLIGEAELTWIDIFETCDRRHGYNLRRDTGTKMIIHEDTRKALSLAQRRRYSRDPENCPQRRLSSLRSKENWANMCPGKRMLVGKRASIRLRKYHYAQCDLDGNVLCIWRSLDELKSHYPKIHIQSIHAVCDGHKATHRGYIWEKVNPAKSPTHLMYSGDAPPMDFGKRLKLPLTWVEVIDKHCGPMRLYKSIGEAAVDYGVSYQTMNLLIRDGYGERWGLIFRRVTPTYIQLQQYRKDDKDFIFYVEDDLG